MKKKLFALLMTLCMLLSLLPTVAFAATDDRVTNGAYTGSTWEPSDSGSIRTTAADGTQLELSKTAVSRGDNTFDITLQIKATTKTTVQLPGAAATVLVMDTSGSMNACAICGDHTNTRGTYIHMGHQGHNNWSGVAASDSRMAAAKNAAIAFLDSYRGDSAGTQRYVAIVSFASGATARQWYDVSTTSGYNAVVNALNGLSASGGTNLDAGLGEAESLFSSDTVSGIPKAQRSVIALTDGKPTYYQSDSERRGDGSNCTQTILDATAATATDLKSAVNMLYTVCFGAAAEHCWNGGPLVGDFLRDRIATSASSAYNAADTSELNNAFRAITSDITTGLSGTGYTVTDPMGPYVHMTDVPDALVTSDGSTYTWTLTDTTPVEGPDGTKTYLYTVTYPVKLDADATGFDESVWHPANDVTLLHWGNEDIGFPVPGLKGVSSRFNVTYLQGEHGTLMQGDSDREQVQYTQVKIHADVVTAERPVPDVRAADGWYFTGWDSNPNGATVTGNMTYTAQYSKKQATSLTVADREVVYDGMEQSGHTTVTEGALQEGHVWSYDYAPAEGVDAGTYSNTDTAFSNVKVLDVDGRDVTEQYAIVTDPGDLKITSRPVVMTSASGSKVYDGQPLTKNTVTAVGFVGDDGASYEVTGSQTDVGTSKNTFTYTLNVGTKANNYNISQVLGDLTVTKITREIVITANSDTKTYDGQPLTNGGFTFTDGILQRGDRLIATVEGTQTNAGSSANVVTSYQVMRGSRNVTANYTFGDSVDGKLTVAKRSVTLTSATDSKEYNGIVLTNDAVTVSGEGFANGEGASYQVTGSQLDVGSSANHFTYALNSGTNAQNYDITKVEGMLTITPQLARIIVTAVSDSKEYDGAALTNDGFTYTGKLVAGDVLTAAVKGTQTNVGSSANVVESCKVMRGDKDVTANYTFGDSVDGKLTVTKRPVTLTSATDSKVYDGTVLTNDTVTVSGKGFANGEGASYQVTGSQLDAGSSANTFIYTLNENTKAGNYNITKVEGTLTVKKAETEIVITAATDRKEYDGTALTNPGFTYTGKLAAGDTLTATVEGSQTDAGSSANVVKSYKVMRDGKDVTANYTFGNSVNGTLSVTPRTVTLTSAGGSKVYDGQPLTNDTVTAEGFVGSDKAEYTVTGSQTDAGQSNNTFTYALKQGVRAENYTIVKVESLLKVTPITDEVVVTILGSTGTYTYNGAARTVTGYSFSADNPLYNADCCSFDGTASVSGTDADAYPMGLKETQFQNISPNFTHVTFRVTDGVLNIQPAPVTVKADDKSKVYGETDPQLTATTVGTVGSDTVSCTLSRASGENVGAYTITPTGAERQGNYTVTYESGTLTITAVTAPVTVTIKGHEKTCTYDGTEKLAEGYDVTNISNALYTERDFVLSGEAIVFGTDAGTYPMGLSTKRFQNISPNFTNVVFEVEDGKLTIDRATVTVTADSLSKTYGETDPELTATVVGVVDHDSGKLLRHLRNILRAGKDGVSYTVSREPGEDVGSYTITPVGEEIQGNYTVTYVTGQLQILPIRSEVVVTITESSDEHVYDGTRKTVEGYEITDISNPLYTENDIAFQGEVAVSGTNVGTYDMALQPEAFANISSNFTNVRFVIVDGALKITPATVIVTANDQVIIGELNGDTGAPDIQLTVEITGLVDGKSKDADDYIVSLELDEDGAYSIIPEDAYPINFTVTLELDEDGNYVIIPAGEEFQGNYRVIYVPGTLTILQRAISITKTVDRTHANVGDKLTYTITVTNTGEAVLENVVVTDEMLNLALEIGDLEVGESWQQQFTYQVRGNDAGKTLVNTAVATSADGTTAEASSGATSISLSVTPKTGDNSQMLLWITLLTVSGGTVVTLGTVNRKRKSQG